uniref:Uncharacterized protein n=1 Tax=Bracon brevicornis TaxID=1563983 RepID=A0A6V7IT75_9HYME
MNEKIIINNTRPAEPENAAVLLVQASIEASSSPESRYPPRQLDNVTRNSWIVSAGTNATTSSHSDLPPKGEEPPLQHDKALTTAQQQTSLPSTSAQPPPSPKILLAPPGLDQSRERRASGGFSGRCPDCGKKREDAASYTIEDLDAADGATLETNFPGQVCTCDEEAGAVSRVPEPSPSYRKPHPDLRKYCSVETSRCYLSPQDALWGYRNEGDTEYHWELHTSRTDVELSRRTKCSCHDLTPEGKRHPDRSDLRKHHSAETDQWSLRADHLGSPHELRKHLSDASGMAREAGQQPAGTMLQVPEVMPNPKPRCTCPKPKTYSPSPIAEKRSTRFQAEDNKIMFSKSLTPEPVPAPPAEEKPELKKAVSVDVRAPLPKRERGRLVQQRAIEKSSMKVKEKVISPLEERKAVRSKWAGMTHFSLQPEKKDFKYGDPKSKSLKERQRYSVRRSLSPEPDPRQILRLDSRIVKRLISPDITITSDPKWAPYEGYSPLPNIGMKKREPAKHIREIKWTPYDGSGSELSIQAVPEEPEPPNDDYHVTPTCHPPPRAPSMKDEDDDEERARWRFLNQVSPFPIYQGAWKECSPEKTPPASPLEPPIWTPMEPPASPVKRRKPSLMVEPPAPVPVKLTKASKKEQKRLKKAESAIARESTMRHALPLVIVRASSEANDEQQRSRQRPLLTRSKALLEVPRKGIDITKRSHSEEVPRQRDRETWRGPSRAKSEESSMYPWNDEGEVTQYVTTV